MTTMKTIWLRIALISIASYRLGWMAIDNLSIIFPSIKSRQSKAPKVIETKLSLPVGANCRLSKRKMMIIRVHKFNKNPTNIQLNCLSHISQNQLSYKSELPWRSRSCSVNSMRAELKKKPFCDQSKRKSVNNWVPICRKMSLIK